MPLLTTAASYLLAIGIVFFVLKLLFRPFERLTNELRAHIGQQAQKDTAINEVVGLLKTQINAIDEREAIAAQRMEEFMAHWKTSDQQYRQLFHELMAANNIGREQCRIHKMETDLQGRAIQDHDRRITGLEKEMKIVKQHQNDEYNC
jgi:hypothetical protein